MTSKGLKVKVGETKVVKTSSRGHMIIESIPVAYAAKEW